GGLLGPEALRVVLAALPEALVLGERLDVGVGRESGPRAEFSGFFQNAFNEGGGRGHDDSSTAGCAQDKGRRERMQPAGPEDQPSAGERVASCSASPVQAVAGGSAKTGVARPVCRSRIVTLC